MERLRPSCRPRCGAAPAVSLQSERVAMWSGPGRFADRVAERLRPSQRRAWEWTVVRRVDVERLHHLRLTQERPCEVCGRKRGFERVAPWSVCVMARPRT